jgi:hypothetical protein
MKKKTRCPITDPEPPKLRGLRLAHEAIRMLSAADLSHAVGGSCETGSLTTDRRSLAC